MVKHAWSEATLRQSPPSCARRPGAALGGRRTHLCPLSDQNLTLTYSSPTPKKTNDATTARDPVNKAHKCIKQLLLSPWLPF